MPGTVFNYGHQTQGVYGTLDQAMAQLSVIVQEYLLPELVDQTKKINPIWERVYNRRAKRSGSNIVQKVRLRDFGNAEFFRGTDTATLARQAVLDAATWDYGHIRVPITLIWEELRATGGDLSKVGELGMRLVQAATEDFKDICGHALFIGQAGSPATVTGTFLKGWNGLCEMVNKSVNNTAATYANIAVDNATATANNQAWSNQTGTANSGGQTGGLGLGATANILEASKLTVACNAAKGKVSILVTTPNGYNRFYAQHYNQQMLQVMDTQRVGFTAMNINGLPLIWDPHCPGAGAVSTITAGTNGATVANPLLDTGTNEWLFALSEDQLELVVDPNADMMATEWSNALGTGQFATVKYIVLSGNLTTSNRRGHGVHVFSS